MPQRPQGAFVGDPTGQASKFSNLFNPGFSFVVDALGSYTWTDEEPRDGFDLGLRSFELGGQAWIDPKAWAFFTAVAEEEEVAIEEAAVHYKGTWERSTLRLGRFFVDFGKQMQAHVHELRTVERPLVLRSYLGSEVRGDGLQFDHWETVGEATVVRGSLGVFANLFPEEQDFLDETFGREVPERQDASELAATARLTGFRDVGRSGILQVGASGRWVPEFTVEDEGGLGAEGFDNQVYGVDLTYSYLSDTLVDTVTVGLEALWSRGDSGFTLLDPDGVADSGDESIESLDGGLFGYYAFADYAFNLRDSVGVQYSDVELAREGNPNADQVELYFTRQLSEFQRIRFALSRFDIDGGEDTTAFLVQYTGFVGAHSHGINW